MNKNAGKEDDELEFLIEQSVNSSMDDAVLWEDLMLRNATSEEIYQQKNIVHTLVVHGMSCNAVFLVKTTGPLLKMTCKYMKISPTDDDFTNKFWFGIVKMELQKDFLKLEQPLKLEGEE